LFFVKYRNIVREFRQRIGDSAPKILRIKAFLLGNRRIILLNEGKVRDENFNMTNLLCGSTIS